MSDDTDDFKVPGTNIVLPKSLIELAADAANLPALKILQKEQENLETVRKTLGGPLALKEMMDRQTQAARLLADGLDTHVLPASTRAAIMASDQAAHLDRLRATGFYDQLMRDTVGAFDTSRSMMGPLSDLRASGLLPILDEIRNARSLTDALTGYESRFITPHQGLFDKLAVEAAAFGNRSASIMEMAKQLRTPWLDQADHMRSLTGFADLQSLGAILRNTAPFTDTAAVGLRDILGDWRDEITWPSTTLDIAARSAFYIERGFRTEVTDFPVPAFEQGLDIAGLGDERGADIAAEYADVLSEPGAPDWSEFERTNKAHMRLMMFEVWLRQVIDRVLTAQFGPDWPRHKLPNGMFDRWQEKKQKAENKGAPVQRVVFYADFTDYVLIVTKGDLWPVFAPSFTSIESVRESFNRLHMPRIETMHARPLSQDDELFLIVEIKRLRRAFRR